MKSLRRVLVAILVALLANWPLTIQAATVACSTSGCTTFQTALNNNTLSTSVTNDAVKSLGIVYNQARTSQLTTTSVSEAKANLQTAFDYLNSYGWVDYMNQALAQVRSNLTTNGFTPTDAQVTSAYNAFVSEGMAVTRTEVQSALTISPSQAQQFYAQLDQVNGWSGVEAEAVQTFSNTVTTSGGGRPILVQAGLRGHAAHLLKIGLGSTCSFIGAYLDVAAIGATISGAGVITGASLLLAVGGATFGLLGTFGAC